jgi:oligopeptide transport system substrate-binding protein
VLNTFKVLLLFIVLQLSISVGCAREEDSDEVATLHRGLNADPESIHPHLHSSNEAATVLRDIGEGLLTYAHDGSLSPGAAESWEISRDQLTIVFTIRDGLNWHDGQPITAYTFEASLKALASPKTGSPYSHLIVPIQNAERIIRGETIPDELGVRALDARTLQIALEAPTPYFLQILAHPSTFPVREAGGTVDVSSTSSQFPSSGAYYIDDYVPGAFWVLKKNEKYWNSVNTTTQRVVYHVVSPESEHLRFRAGELDITDSVDEDAFRQFREDGSDALRVAPMLGVYFLGFNLDKVPLRDSRDFRQALYLAVDRQAIVESVLGRGELAAFGMVPSGVANYSRPDILAENLSQEEREKLARELLDRSGLGVNDPIEITVLYNTGGGHERILLSIQEMWRKSLGIRFHLRGEEFRVFLSNVRDAKSTDIFRLSWTGDFNDAYAFLQVFASESGVNLTGYSNSLVDELLSESITSRDQKERSELLARVEAKVISDYPVIPLYYYVSKHLVAPRVQGWSPNVLDIHLSRHLSVSLERP